MAYTPTVFSQLLAVISRERFQSIVERYKGDFHVRTYSCWSHLVIMIFAQVTDKESLRDLEMALLSKKNFSIILASCERRAQRSRMPTRHATGKSIATCFMNW